MAVGSTFMLISAATYLLGEGEHEYRETNGERNLFEHWNKLHAFVGFDTKVKGNYIEKDSEGMKLEL